MAPPRALVSFFSVIAQFGIQVVLLHSIEKIEFLDVTFHFVTGSVTRVLDSGAEFSFLFEDFLIDAIG